jgi:hypothetical protein
MCILFKDFCFQIILISHFTTRVWLDSLRVVSRAFSTSRESSRALSRQVESRVELKFFKSRVESSKSSRVETVSFSQCNKSFQILKTRCWKCYWLRTASKSFILAISTTFRVNPVTCGRKTFAKLPLQRIFHTQISNILPTRLGRHKSSRVEFQ